ncbi:MAG: hypothetical protein JKX72_07955 [Robiginitomaculum sp.]|nr:hypothetical protein [Robiginitomaculum sp.]
MKIKFQPMWGLTIATLICLGILLTLGTWQYKRLHWKTKILAEIEQAGNAPPLQSLQEINMLLAAGKPVDFRRIAMGVNFTLPIINEGQPFHLLRSTGKAFSWRFYQPISEGTSQAYVATREFVKGPMATPPKALSGENTLIGYVRLVQKTNWTIPKSDPKANRWFSFNARPEVLDWSVGGTIATAYYIDAAPHIKAVENLPVRMPEIPNNHLDYMLTWYSFALILLVIYFLLHRKQGRLRIERGKP